MAVPPETTRNTNSSAENSHSTPTHRSTVILVNQRKLSNEPNSGSPSPKTGFSPTLPHAFSPTLSPTLDPNSQNTLHPPLLIPQFNLKKSHNTTFEKLVGEVLPLPNHTPRKLTRAVSKHAIAGQWNENITFLNDVDTLKEEILEKEMTTHKKRESIEKENQIKFQEIFDKYISNKKQPINIASTLRDKLISENEHHQFTLETFLKVQEEIRLLVKYKLPDFKCSAELKVLEEVQNASKLVIDTLLNLEITLDIYLSKNASDKNWKPSRLCCCASDFNKAQVYKIIENLKTQLSQGKISGKNQEFDFKKNMESLKINIKNLKMALGEILDSFKTEILGNKFPLTIKIVNAYHILDNSLTLLISQSQQTTAREEIEKLSEVTEEEGLNLCSFSAHHQPTRAKA